MLSCSFKVVHLFRLHAPLQWVVCGEPKQFFLSCILSLQTWQAALGTLNPNPTDSCSLYLNQAAVAALPSRVSRHNSPSSAHFLSRIVRSCLPGGSNRCIVVSVFNFCWLLVIVLYCLALFWYVWEFLGYPVEKLVIKRGSFIPVQMVCERSDVFASSCAIARAFPIFSRRSTASRRTDKKHVTVEFLIVGNDSSSLDPAELEVNTSVTWFIGAAHFRAVRFQLFAVASKLFFCSVSLQHRRWCSASSSDRGHTMQWDEHRPLPGCKSVFRETGWFSCSCNQSVPLLLDTCH